MIEVHTLAVQKCLAREDSLSSLCWRHQRGSMGVQSREHLSRGVSVEQELFDTIKTDMVVQFIVVVIFIVALPVVQLKQTSNHSFGI